MRFGLALLSLLLAAPALGAPPSVSMDVAPSTLELKPGAAELFYVTNHGDEPVTVELEGFDWSQSDNRDARLCIERIAVSRRHTSVSASIKSRA